MSFICKTCRHSLSTVSGIRSHIRKKHKVKGKILKGTYFEQSEETVDKTAVKILSRLNSKALASIVEGGKLDSIQKAALDVLSGR